MKIKTSCVCFFKDSLNKKAVTPTSELGEGKVSNFAMFKYERSSSKTKRVFKKTNTQFPINKVRQPYQLQVRFMLKIITVGEKEGQIILQKDLKHNRPRAGAHK